MKTIRVLFILMVLLALNSCSDLTSGQRFKRDYIVVTGTIYAGEPITLDNPIFIGRSISIKGGNLSDLFYNEAAVYIEDTETLERKDLIFGFDLLSSVIRMGYFDPRKDFIIESGKTYRITAIVGQDSIWAETTVPDEFTVLDNAGYTLSAIEPYPQMIHKEIDKLYPIEMKVKRRENTNVCMEYYCLEEWYNAHFALGDYVGISIGIESAEDYENVMTGSPRRERDISLYYPSVGDEGYIINLPFNQVNFFFYGRYSVTVMLTDDNFFRYNYKSQGYYHGGINNGIGYFGSAARKVMFTEVIKEI